MNKFLIVFSMFILCGCTDDSKNHPSIFEPPRCLPAGNGTCEYNPTDQTNPLNGTKDYCMIYSPIDELYHVIGIWWIDGSKTFPEGKWLHHATSPDLVNWTMKDPIDIRLGDGSWNNDGIWAPQITFKPDEKLFYMFYTGVIGTEWYNRGQRIGCVTSPDLINWSHVDRLDSGMRGMVFGEEHLQEWCEWQYDGTGTIGNPKVGDLRDPHVYWNPETELWNMLVSIKLKSSNVMSQAVISSSDLIGWTSLGFDERIVVADGGGVFGTQTGSESASIIRLNEKWIISWTNVQYGGPWDTDIRFAISDDLVGGNFELIDDEMYYGFASEIQYIGQGQLATPVYSVVAINGQHMRVQFKCLDLRDEIVSMNPLMDCDIEMGRY